MDRTPTAARDAKERPSPLDATRSRTPERNSKSGAIRTSWNAKSVSTEAEWVCVVAVTEFVPDAVVGVADRR